MSLAMFAKVSELEAALRDEIARRIELETRVAALEAKRTLGLPPKSETKAA